MANFRIQFIVSFLFCISGVLGLSSFQLALAGDELTYSSENYVNPVRWKDRNPVDVHCNTVLVDYAVRSCISRYNSDSPEEFLSNFSKISVRDPLTKWGFPPSDGDALGVRVLGKCLANDLNFGIQAYCNCQTESDLLVGLVNSFDPIYIARGVLLRACSKNRRD